MIKAVIFDLDGVLVDADKLHYDAFNKALGLNDQDEISWQEHLTIYKGLPTREKLEILGQRRKFLSPELCDIIHDSKQRITEELIEQSVFYDPEKVEMLRILKESYKILVCSNAIRRTVDKLLKYTSLGLYVDHSFSNEDVNFSKPDPEIYHVAMDAISAYPWEVVIIEDSDVGYQAAIASKAHVCKVNGPDEVNYYRVLNSIVKAERINVVIPAAGQGKRFAEAGYAYPKPLIPLNGRPMLELVLDNFRDMGNFIVLMQRQHIERYCADEILKAAEPMVEIVPVDGLTQGAACTVLLAEHLIDNNNELVIANSDQYLSSLHIVYDFVQAMRKIKADGGILTFKSDDSKWSYAACNADNLVREVAEKDPISEHATVGIYYFRHGKDFVKYAKQMFFKNIRTNNEFYVCPVFNEAIRDGKLIYIYPIDNSIMHGLGTPEDLEAFIAYEDLL